MKMYSREHQWVESKGEKAYLGITEFAAKQLGDIVFVELPAINDQFAVGEVIARVESVKSSSEIYCPVSGEVLAIKEELEDAPEMLNADPEGEVWIAEIRLENPKELDELMTKEEYIAGLSN